MSRVGRINSPTADTDRGVSHSLLQVEQVSPVQPGFVGQEGRTANIPGVAGLSRTNYNQLDLPSSGPARCQAGISLPLQFKCPAQCPGPLEVRPPLFYPTSQKYQSPWLGWFAYSWAGHFSLGWEKLQSLSTLSGHRVAGQQCWKTDI